MDSNDIEPVEEVIPESTLPDKSLDVPICSRNDSKIYLLWLDTSYPYYFLLLQDSKDFSLHLHWHICNFIKEYRALVGNLKLTRLPVPIRSCKGPGLVSKKLRL